MRRYKIQENGVVPHYITWTLSDWLSVFVSSKYCDIVVNSLDYCRRVKGLLVHSYVIMPSHVHAILSVQRDGDLVGVMRDSRKFMAKEIARQLNQDNHRLFGWAFRDAARRCGRPEGSYAVWQSGAHPEAIETTGFALQKLNYIHENPVRKGLIWAPEHWRYSSAGDYAGGQPGPLAVDMLEL